MSLSALNPNALQEVGEPIPDTAHAVSVSLPSWRSNVGYEEGEEWVVSKMRSGYPRFFVHPSIVSLQSKILERFGNTNEEALLFPSVAIAKRCAHFIERFGDDEFGKLRQACRISEMIPIHREPQDGHFHKWQIALTAIFFDSCLSTVARKFWQHTGEGVSSRRAEFFAKAFEDGHLTLVEVEQPPSTGKSLSSRGPRRYRKDDGKLGDIDLRSHKTSHSKGDAPEDLDYMKFVEERFGRNLDVSLAKKAKVAIRKRIAGSLKADIGLESVDDIPEFEGLSRDTPGFSKDQVYLFPAGMSAIYNAHRYMIALRGELPSIMFGFPYTDTLKVLEKFGSQPCFYGNGSSADLDDLEMRCKSGERFLALFCEFPGNPLLQTPDLHRIRRLSDRYDFMVVVDETIGNFLNVNILPAADIAVSSLTKVFSGDSNAMGGSLVLNPNGKYFESLQQILATQYVDHLWYEDALFLERNSRDFVQRNRRINANASSLAQLLNQFRKVKMVNYPELSSSRRFYDEFRNPDGGYSGLLSVTFHSKADAITFYDALATAKGPSLGTNFTLSSPFVILAHYHELDWVKQFGVEPDLIRVSVGLEPTHQLLQTFQNALDAVGVN